MKREVVKVHQLKVDQFVVDSPHDTDFEATNPPGGAIALLLGCPCDHLIDSLFRLYGAVAVNGVVVRTRSLWFPLNSFVKGEENG